MPQQAMRQATSEGKARGASVRGAPTRSMRGRERKREGGHVRPGVRVKEGVTVWLGVEERVAAWLKDADAVWLEDGVKVWLEEGVDVWLDDGVEV